MCVSVLGEGSVAFSAAQADRKSQQKYVICDQVMITHNVPLEPHAEKAPGDIPGVFIQR